MIPGLIGHERDVNAANSQPLSSPNFGSRRRDSAHAGEETVSERISDTQEVNDNNGINYIARNDVNNDRIDQR